MQKQHSLLLPRAYWLTVCVQLALGTAIAPLMSEAGVHLINMIRLLTHRLRPTNSPTRVRHLLLAPRDRRPSRPAQALHLPDAAPHPTASYSAVRLTSIPSTQQEAPGAALVVRELGEPPVPRCAETRRHRTDRAVRAAARPAPRLCSRFDSNIIVQNLRVQCALVSAGV